MVDNAADKCSAQKKRAQGVAARARGEGDSVQQEKGVFAKTHAAMSRHTWRRWRRPDGVFAPKHKKLGMVVACTQHIVRSNCTVHIYKLEPVGLTVDRILEMAYY